MVREWPVEEQAHGKKQICKEPELFIQDKDKKNSWQIILTMCIQSTWAKALKCLLTKATQKFLSQTTIKTNKEEDKLLNLSSEV